MKKNTHITIVLDKSGSMGTIANDTIGGFNHFIAEQKKVDGICTLSLLTFNTTNEFVHENLDIQLVPNLNNETYQPGGGTALNDAIMKGIKNAEHAAGVDTNVIFVIITDGEENSSHNYSTSDVKTAIEKAQAGKCSTCDHPGNKFQFVYLGANVDSFVEAEALGITTANVATVAFTSKGTESSYSVVSENVAGLRSGAVASMAFDENQKKKMTDGDSSIQTSPS